MMGMIMPFVMLMHNGVPTAPRNQPTIDRESNQACQNHRNRKADPETTRHQSGGHRTRYDHHHGVVDNLHHDDGNGIGSMKCIRPAVTRQMATFLKAGLACWKCPAKVKVAHYGRVQPRLRARQA